MGEFDDLLAKYGTSSGSATSGEFDDLLRKYQDTSYAPSSQDEPNPYWDAIKRYGLAPLQGLANTTGALVGKTISAVAPDAYQRASEANLAGVVDPNYAQQLAAAPAAGQVIAEAIAPGEPENPWARAAKNVGSLAGDILLDPLTYMTGGVAGAAKAVGAGSKLAKGAKLGQEAAEVLVRGKRGIIGPLTEAASSEVARYAGKGKAGLYAQAGADVLGSAPLAAAYGPEIVQGVYEGGKRAFNDAQAGDYQSAAASGLEAALIGGLGALMGKGLIDETRAYQALRKERLSGRLGEDVKAKAEEDEAIYVEPEEELPNELVPEEDGIVDLTGDLEPQIQASPLKRPDFLDDLQEDAPEGPGAPQGYGRDGKPVLDREPPLEAPERSVKDLGRGLGNLARRRGFVQENPEIKSPEVGGDKYEEAPGPEATETREVTDDPNKPGDNPPQPEIPLEVAPPLESLHDISNQDLKDFKTMSAPGLREQLAMRGVSVEKRNGKNLNRVELRRLLEKRYEEQNPKVAEAPVEAPPPVDRKALLDQAKAILDEEGEPNKLNDKGDNLSGLARAYEEGAKGNLKAAESLAREGEEAKSAFARKRAEKSLRLAARLKPIVEGLEASTKIGAASARGAAGLKETIKTGGSEQAPVPVTRGALDRSLKIEQEVETEQPKTLANQELEERRRDPLGRVHVREVAQRLYGEAGDTKKLEQNLANAKEGKGSLWENEPPKDWKGGYGSSWRKIINNIYLTGETAAGPKTIFEHFKGVQKIVDDYHGKPSPAPAPYNPSGLKYNDQSVGSFNRVFELDKDTVLRLSAYPNSPVVNKPWMLPAKKNGVTPEGFRYDILPKAELLDNFDDSKNDRMYPNWREDIGKLQTKVESDGYASIDVKKANIGYYKGELYITDRGAVMPFGGEWGDYIHRQEVEGEAEAPRYKNAQEAEKAATKLAKELPTMKVKASDSKPASGRTWGQIMAPLRTLAEKAGLKGVRTVRQTIREDFYNKKMTSLIGAKVDPNDIASSLALINRVNRAPFEILHLVALKNGRIVFHNALTSRLASAIDWRHPEVISTMEKLEAMTKSGEIDGWYDLHNHPGGIPTPSDGDIKSSEAFHEISRTGYRGGVITDHEKYGFTRLQGAKKPTGVENFKPEHMAIIGPDHVFENSPLAKTDAISQDAHILDLARFAKSTQGNEDAPVFTYLSNRLTVRGVQFIPFQTMRDVDFMAAYVKKQAALMGGGVVMAHYESRGDFRADQLFQALAYKLRQAGVIHEGIQTKGGDPVSFTRHQAGSESQRGLVTQGGDVGSNELHRIGQEVEEPDVPTFYSSLAKAADGSKMPQVASGNDYLNFLRKQEGVKEAEIKWTELDEFLKNKSKVTKSEVQEFLKKQAVEVKETVLGGPPTLTQAELERYNDLSNMLDELEVFPNNAPKLTDKEVEEFNKLEAKYKSRDTPKYADSRYQLPGGANYRELVFSTPYAYSEGRILAAHFSNIENQIAHVRFNERTDVYGKKVLFIEEIQSDIANNMKKVWHGESPLPLVDDYHSLAIKRMIRWAAENGFDKIAWTTGRMQNERYALSNHIEKLWFRDEHGIGTKRVVLRTKTNNNLIIDVDDKGKLIDNPNVVNDNANLPGVAGEKTLHNLLGKELAEQIINAKEPGELSGLSLEVGGQGKRALYDKIIPDTANRIGKKFGARVGETRIDVKPLDAPDDGGTIRAVVPSLPITPEMKHSVMKKGQALFQDLDPEAQKALDNATLARKTILEKQPKGEVRLSPEEIQELARKYLEQPDLKKSEGGPQKSPDVALNLEKFKLMSPEQRAKVAAVLEELNEKLKRSQPKEWNTVKAQQDLNNAMLQKSWLEVEERAKAHLTNKDDLNAKETFEMAIADAAVMTSILKDPVTTAARIVAAQREAHKGTASTDGLMMKRFMKSLMARGLSKQKSEMLRDIYKNKPGDFAEALRKAMQPGIGDKALEWWIAGLVSAPTTRAANIASNFVFRGLRDSEHLLSIGLDKARVAIFGGERKRYKEEALMAATAYRDALLGTDGSNGAIGEWLKNKGGLTLKPLETFGKGISDIDFWRTKGGAIGGTFGEAVRIPFKGLEVDDGFFKHLSGLREIYNEAVRAAYQENASDILKRAKEIAAEIMEVKELGEESHLFPEHSAKLDRIAETMRRDTFQAPLEGILHAIEKLSRDHKLVKIILPFVKTPGNIAREAIQRTPFGFWTSYRRLVKEFHGGKIDSGRLADEMAKPLMGSLLGATFAMAAYEGLLTGGGPGEYDKEQALRETGWQPYSLKIGDQYLSYQRLEPFSSIMGMSADLAEGIKQGKTLSYPKLATRIVSSIVENLTSKTFLAGLEGFFTAMHDPLRYGERFIKQLEGSLVPNIVGAAARATDNKFRQTEIGLDPIKAKIPGLSKTLPAQLTPTGQERKRPGSALERFASPISRTVEDHSLEGDVAREMVRIDYVPRKISNQVTIKGVHIPLSQKDKLYLGQAQKKATLALAQIMKSNSYNKLPDNQDDPKWKFGMTTKRDIAEKTYRKYISAARSQINPRLVQELIKGESK